MQTAKQNTIFMVVLANAIHSNNYKFLVVRDKTYEKPIQYNMVAF